MQDAPAKKHPGEVLEIESEEELDKILQENKDSLTILLGSLTWCRPCKTLAKPLQVITALQRYWCLHHGQPSASARLKRCGILISRHQRYVHVHYSGMSQEGKHGHVCCVGQASATHLKLTCPEPQATEVSHAICPQQ